MRAKFAKWIKKCVGASLTLAGVLSVKLDAPAPCRLVASDLDFACRVSADCLPQHLQVI